jgi:hypothetical protein
MATEIDDTRKWPSGFSTQCDQLYPAFSGVLRVTDSDGTQEKAPSLPRGYSFALNKSQIGDSVYFQNNNPTCPNGTARPKIFRLLNQ